MSNNSLTIFIANKKEETFQPNTDAYIYTTRRNLDAVVNKALSEGKYDKIIIAYKNICTDVIRHISSELEECDAVFASARVRTGLLGKILYKLFGIVLRLFVPMENRPDKLCGVVGFNKHSLIRNSMKLYFPFLLISVLLNLKPHSKIKRVSTGNIYIDFSSFRFFSFIGSLVGIGKHTGEFYRALKFAIVGASGILVNEFMLWFLTEHFLLFYLISSIFAIELSILSNFLLNDLWTFGDRRVPGFSNTIKRLLKYNAISWSTGSINWFVLASLKEFLGIYYLIANLIGIFVAFIGNLLLSSLWAWRATSSFYQKTGLTFEFLS